MTDAAQHQTLADNEKFQTEMEQSHSSLLLYDMCTDFKDYEYEDLGVPSTADVNYRDKKRFRLLSLISGVLQDSTVYCEIFEVEFDIAKDEVLIVQDSDCVAPGRGCIKACSKATTQSISYEAMSWRWGNESEGKYAILIKTNDGDRKKTVSYTLGLALKHLRYSTRPRMIWIDALCINQDNFDERSSQVAMMDRLYTGASQICVWLGRDDPDSRIAIKFIKEEINELRDFDTLCKNSKHAGKWRALLGLMQRDWFSRRWVVQELALARKATVYCGPDQIDWRDLAIAIELFVEVESATHRLSELMKKDDRFNVIPNWFEHISELGASLLVTETSKIFRDYKRESDKRPLGLGHLALSGPGRRSLLSLEYLVTSLSIFDCGRPHDYVYALVAISRDAFPSPPTSITQRSKEALVTEVMKGFVERKPFPLDYDIPYPDVARDFIEFTIQRHLDTAKDGEKALDILCRPWSKAWRLEDEETQEQSTENHNKGLFKDRDIDQTALEDWRNKVKEKAFGNTIISEEYCKKKWEPWFKTEEANPRGKGNKAYTSGVPTTTGASMAAKTPCIHLPSWVSDVTKAPFDIFRHPGVEITKMGRKNADPLVGSLDNGGGTYSAAQSKTQNRNEINFKKRAGLKHYSLYVRGFRFDKVDIVEQVSQQGAIPASWLRLGGWETAIRPKSPGADPGIPPDALWRTLVADRGMHNQNPPYYYSRACKETIMKGALRSNAVDTTALIYNERNSIIAEFCRRTQCVIWNRAMIKTENGHLGLVSPNVRKGDLICIIYGCTVPVILRKSAKLKTGKDRRDEMKDDCLEAFRRCFNNCLQSRARKFEYDKQSTDHKTQVKQELDLWKAKKMAQTILENGIENWQRLVQGENGGFSEGEHQVNEGETTFTQTELETWVKGHPWQRCHDALMREIDAFEEEAKMALLTWKSWPDLPESPREKKMVNKWLRRGPSKVNLATVKFIKSWMNMMPDAVKEQNPTPHWVSMWRWLVREERDLVPEEIGIEALEEPAKKSNERPAEETANTEKPAEEPAVGRVAEEVTDDEKWLRWWREKPSLKAWTGGPGNGQDESVNIDMRKLRQEIKEWDEVKGRLDKAVQLREARRLKNHKKKMENELRSWKKSIQDRGARGTNRWSQMPSRSSLGLDFAMDQMPDSVHFSSDEESDGGSEDEAKDWDIEDKQDEEIQTGSESEYEGTESAQGNDKKVSFTRAHGKKERQKMACERDPFRHYEFLGEAYIHGMMEGEAVSQSFYKKKPEHIFELR